MFLLSSADLFSKLTFSKISFTNTIRVSNNLDPYQNRRFVVPDLGSNYLQRLSADLAMKRLATKWPMPVQEVGMNSVWPAVSTI